MRPVKEIEKELGDLNLIAGSVDGEPHIPSAILRALIINTSILLDIQHRISSIESDVFTLERLVYKKFK